jgi:hypothetical protein
MKCKTENLIIEAALRSIADALPVIAAEAEAEQEENDEHVKFIDRLESKIDELAKELWLCEEKAKSDTACLAYENDRLKKRMSEMDHLIGEEIEVWEDKLHGHLDYIKELEAKLATEIDASMLFEAIYELEAANRELESNLRTEKIKTEHYGERLKEFTIIVDETDAYWRKKDLRNKAYIEYLNALLANNEESMRHEEALEENAARDGREQLAWDLEPYIRINERFRVNEQS